MLNLKEISKSVGFNLDLVKGYANALDSDISTTTHDVVENGTVHTYWVGTVYHSKVSTEHGSKFKTKMGALANAKHFVEKCKKSLSNLHKTKGV